MSNKKQKTFYRVGENISRYNNISKKGKEIYDNDDVYKNEDKISKLKKASLLWSKSEIDEDIKKLSSLETLINKNLFSSMYVGEDRETISILTDVYKELNLKMFKLLDNYQQAKDTLKSSNINLTLSKYRFNNNPDGRSLQKLVNKNIEKFKERDFPHNCIISGYTPTEFMNLVRDGCEIFNGLIESDSRKKIHENLKTLINGYYILYLIETVTDKNTMLKFKNRDKKFKESISSLESAASKSRFNILLVHNEMDQLKKWDELTKKEGFCKVFLANNVKEANDLLETENINVVISDYRLDHQANANKLYDYIQLHKKHLNSEIDFCVSSDMCVSEKNNLTKKGIWVHDSKEFSDLIKGFYVKNIRRVINKLS